MSTVGATLYARALMAQPRLWKSLVYLRGGHLVIISFSAVVCEGLRLV
jgi:hypothetical protein